VAAIEIEGGGIIDSMSRPFLIALVAVTYYWRATMACGLMSNVAVGAQNRWMAHEANVAIFVT
jgi:hypothetical protein